MVILAYRKKTDFIDRDVSYITLIPDGNVESLHAEIKRLFVYRNKCTRLFNSEARFVVAGTNNFSFSHPPGILGYFSQFRIYNCIIVSREHYVMHKGYDRPINSNDTDTGMKLGVYTWLPYQSSHRCTEVNDIILLDNWVISAQGHFTKNTDLFPRKTSNSLNGCPMKSVVRDGNWNLTMMYDYYTYSNGGVVMHTI